MGDMVKSQVEQTGKQQLEAAKAAWLAEVNAFWVHVAIFVYMCLLLHVVRVCYMYMALHLSCVGSKELDCGHEKDHCFLERRTVTNA